MGLIQNYEWGTIEWLTDQGRTTAEVLDIGITTILSGYAQEKHIHYGDEQWLYVVSGTGISVVDDVECVMKPGDSVHIPAGAIHETRNTGEIPLVEMLISYPKQLDYIWTEQNTSLSSSMNLIDVSDQELILGEDDIELISAFGETLALPITIFNTHGETLFTWNQFPKPCIDLCKIDEGLNQCHIYAQQISYSSPGYSEQSAYYCKYGLAIIDTPMILNNQMIGRIRGGHILTEDNNEKIHPLLKGLTKNSANIPKGRLRIILNQYKKLAYQLAEAHHNQLAQNPVEGEDQRNKSTLDIRTLKGDLNLAMGRILNLQINNHFLFNTLNAIAGLALEEDSFKTYRSIIDLSKLFRYNLRTSQEFVSIKDEVNYIKNYSALQKIRFGDRLKVDIKVPEDALKFYIPFNTLQPIVENAFVHGFRNYEDNMVIELTVESLEKTIELSIKDNGQGVTNDIKELMLKKLEEVSAPRRGLSMIIDRLRLFFGNDFSYKIESEFGSGFEIRLIIPKRALKEDMMGGLS